LKALSEAAARQDTDAVAFQAHRLKGSVINFGAHAMSLLCQSVEMAAKAGDLAQTESLLDSLKTEAERLRRALQRERRAAPGASAA
jgi:HPt (histidine-containing phosphotransfer) domain-containing protein